MKNSSSPIMSRLTGLVLAILPIASFLGQYALSVQAGTQNIMLHHLTVVVVDWVFVPFNYFISRVIDWRRGASIFLIACISVILNVLTHAFWQYKGLDLGHMITVTGIVLPAGWVHLAFSVIQMVLLMSFVFCRKLCVPEIGICTFLSTIYFTTMGVCGYLMHNGFNPSDVVVFISGLFFVLIYPRLKHRMISASGPNKESSPPAS